MYNLWKYLGDLCEEFLFEKNVPVGDEILTWPNLITTLGILGIGVYIFQYTTETLIILIPITVFLIGFSDLLDGFTARRLNQHTWIGKLLDSLRDKLLRFTFFINLLFIEDSIFIIALLLFVVLASEGIIFFYDLRSYFQKIIIKGHPVSRFAQIPPLLSIGIIVISEYWFHQYIPIMLLIWVVPLCSVAALFLYPRKAFS